MIYSCKAVIFLFCFILFYVTVNIFGNGAAYFTFSVMVVSLSGCWAAMCVLNKKRETWNKNVPANVDPRTSL